MRAPTHVAVRRPGRSRQRGPSALALLLTAVTAIVPLLGGTPASAARATDGIGSAGRSAPAAASYLRPASSYLSPASTITTPAGGETRRSARPAARTAAAGTTRRLHSAQDAALDHHRPATHAAGAHHPGQPGVGAADPTGPPPSATTPRCSLPDPSPRHRFLPVGAGRSPPASCGS